MNYLVDFCRLCLTFEGDFNNMCNDNIMEKATACIGDLDYDYNLPSLICNKCLENLDNFFEFRNRCLQSEFLLNYYIEQIFQSKQTKKFKSTNLKVNLNNNYNPSPVEGKGIKVQVRCDNSKLPSHVPPIEFENVNTQNEIVIIEDSDFEEVDDIFLEEEEDYNGAQSIFGNLRDNLKRKFDEISEPLNKTVDNSASIIGAHRKQTRDVFSPNIVTNIMERVKLQKRKVQLERSNNANVEGEKLTTPMDIPLITENNPNSSITPPLSPQNSSIIPPTIPLNSNITLPISPPNSGIKQQIVPLKFKTKSPCNPPNYSIKPVVSSSNPILKPQIIRLNSNVKPQVSSSKPQLRIFNKSDWYNLEKSTGRSCIYRHEIPTPTPASEISTITDLENDITCHHITYKKADSELLQQLSDTKLSSTDDNIVLNTIPPISTLNVNHKVQKKLQQQPLKKKLQLQPLKKKLQQQPLNHVMYQQDLGLQTPNNELYKANFANMLKLNESTYLNIDPNVHHGPLNILLKKVGQPQQMKLKTIPVLHNIQPNMALHSDMHQPVSILASYLSSATSLPQTLISSPEKSNTNSKTKYAHVKNVPKCQKIRILRYKPNYGTELLNNANRKRLSTISTSQIEDTSKRNPAPQLERSKNISYQTKISDKREHLPLHVPIKMEKEIKIEDTLCDDIFVLN